MAAVVTGMALQSALGNRDRTWNAILAKKSGIRLARIFPELPILPVATIGEKPIAVGELTRTLVAELIVDAELTLPQPECAIVVGSSRSCQGDWERMLAAGKIGDGFLDTLPQTPATIVRQSIGACGYLIAPMAACATGLWTIAMAAELIASKRVDRVIAGAIETPISPLTIVGFRQLGAYATTGCYPFDKAREGLVLGEGGALLLLEDESVARSRNARIYGQILGSGMTTDAFHPCQLDIGGIGIRIAIADSLTRAGLVPQDIDYIHAHGTATPQGDLHDSTSIAALFPHDIPVSSTKGATGHTLGASGAFGAAFCLLAMRDRLLPPTVGLENPDFSLNFVTHPQPTDCRFALCLSSGFGGQNVSIAIGSATGI